MENFPKNWKFFKVNFYETKWDFLIDGGMHSVFSTFSDIKLNFIKCFRNNQFEFSRIKGPTIISIFDNQKNQIYNDFEITMNYFILKIEKKSTIIINDIINKILFEFGLNNTQLYSHIISPRVPLIFIQETLFRLGWFEPNLSIINIPIFPLSTCTLHTIFARQIFNLEFKPKCILPLLTKEFTLYRILQKIIKDNSWIANCTAVTLDKINQEFELLLRYKRLCGVKDIPCQISIQKLSKNDNFENSYSPIHLFFSKSNNQLFSDFLNALNISGKIIQNNSITTVNHFIKNHEFTEIIQNEIPIFSESLSHFSQIFHKLILYQTFCAGQQLLAYYLYVVLKYIIPINHIQNLINNQTMIISTKIEDISSSNSDLMSFEFYNNKVNENFQFGLLYLTKLIFHINKNFSNQNHHNQDISEVINSNTEFGHAVQDATLWLSKFLLGRSICDCSLIITVIYTNKHCLCPNYSDFKLIKTFQLNSESIISPQTEFNNNEYLNSWARIKIIDISNKPLEKITHWKSQFLNLVKKLIIHHKKHKKI